MGVVGGAPGLVPGRPPAPALLPKLAPLLTDDAEPVGQFWLARAVGDYLADLTAPLLVVLEDVHRADDETLHLLRHLATRLAGTPILVLLTHRPDEATTDLMATGAALAAQTAEHLTLEGLGEDEIAQLVLDRSGVAVGPATLTVLTERTGGNPLFVSETAAAAGGRGREGGLPAASGGPRRHPQAHRPPSGHRADHAARRRRGRAATPTPTC